MKDQALPEYQDALKFLMLIKSYWKNILVFIIITGFVLTILSLQYPWQQRDRIAYLFLVRSEVSALWLFMAIYFLQC